MFVLKRFLMHKHHQNCMHAIFADQRLLLQMPRCPVCLPTVLSQRPARPTYKPQTIPTFTLPFLRRSHKLCLAGAPPLSPASIHCKQTKGTARYCQKRCSQRQWMATRPNNLFPTPPSRCKQSFQVCSPKKPAKYYCMPSNFVWLIRPRCLHFIKRPATIASAKPKQCLPSLMTVAPPSVQKCSKWHGMHP